MNKNEIIPVSESPAIKMLDLAEVMATELEGMDITFDRVTIPAGGSTTFELPHGQNGESESVKEFNAVILCHHPLFTYYRERFTGGNNAPDCYSYDGVTGVGNPGGSCARCPLNQYGSGENGGKACKNKRRIYLVREGELFPMLLTLPTGSIRSLTDYLKELLTEGKFSHGVVTKFSLKKVQNANNISYSRAQFTNVRSLTAEESSYAQNMGKQLKAYATRVPCDDFPAEMIDPETGEVLNPLT